MAPGSDSDPLTPMKNLVRPWGEGLAAVGGGGAALLLVLPLIAGLLDCFTIR